MAKKKYHTFCKIGKNNIILLAQTPQNEQGLERFLSCAARKSEHTCKKIGMKKTDIAASLIQRTAFSHSLVKNLQHTFGTFEKYLTPF